MFQKEITFFEQSCILSCDGKCHKAWGLNGRPYTQLDPNNDDDIVWHSDEELGIAPITTGMSEGFHGKPENITSSDEMNKWCARECERCTKTRPNEPIVLKDWSKRVYNIKR